MSVLHPSVSALVSLGTVLHEELPQDQIEQAHALIDQLPAELSAEEITALLPVLPANGDTAFGLNWSILHAVEASDHWPIWSLLADENHEWTRIFLIRLANAGEFPPDGDPKARNVSP